jgi:hypothetical protein
MRDAAGHLADRIHPLRSRSRFLCGLSAREIVHDAYKGDFTRDVGAPYGKMQWKDTPVGAKTFDVTPDPDDPFFTCLEMMSQKAIVLRGHGIRHQNANVLSYQSIRRMTKECCCGLVHPHDIAQVIRNDHGIDRSIQEGEQDRAFVVDLHAMVP